MRESAAITIIQHILKIGAVVQAYDPKAINNFSQLFPPSPSISYYTNTYTATQNSDAVLILTEWEEFRTIDLAKLKKSMRGNSILDTRNILDPSSAKQEGFVYQGIGR